MNNVLDTWSVLGNCFTN